MTTLETANIAFRITVKAILALLAILAFNMLFTLSIPITVGTWASSYLLISFFKPMTNCCDKS